MKVGDTVQHVTYDWIGVVVKYKQWAGYWVWWSGWPDEFNPDGPMQEYWLKEAK